MWSISDDVETIAHWSITTVLLLLYPPLLLLALLVQSVYNDLSVLVVNKHYYCRLLFISISNKYKEFYSGTQSLLQKLLYCTHRSPDRGTERQEGAVVRSPVPSVHVLCVRFEPRRKTSPWIVVDRT